MATTISSTASKALSRAKASVAASTPKKVKPIAQGGPSKLTTILGQLNAKPRLALPGVKALKLTYAFRNDHFGARHFAKEDLPRVRWANPTLDIQVERPNKTKDEHWKPELRIDFLDGESQTINLTNKLSTSVLLELMESAGGKPWAEHKAASEAAGSPLFPSSAPSPSSEASEAAPSPTRPAQSTPTDLPSFEAFKATQPDAGKPKPKTTEAPVKKVKTAEGAAATPAPEAAKTEVAAPAS